jgi:two-component system, NarL family, invasion response regulator UvrY
MKHVLLVDDHPLYSQGVQSVLSVDHSMQIQNCMTAQSAIDRVKNENWDLVILDISLPDRNGLDLLKQIKTIKPSTPVLILTIHSEEQYALRVLKAGASGFLTKQACRETLVTAVRKVMDGGRYVAQSLADKLTNSLSGSMQSAYETLSDREMQVLCMIASGKGVKEIGEELKLSVKTVSTYRARILEKLGKSNNAELIQFAILNRLVPEVPLSGRRYERLDVHFESTIRGENVNCVAKVCNVSLGGVCVETTEKFVDGQDLRIQLRENLTSEEINCDARVIWQLDQRYGMTFINLPEKIKKIIYRWMRNSAQV